MAKDLSEMTLEELWQLFPIFLTEHNPRWAEWYCEEEQLLLEHLPQDAVHRISHIGSTSVSGIWAKPIVDILIEIKAGCDIESVIAATQSCGYRCMSRDGMRVSFNKGYTPDGFAEKVFHLHLRQAGDNNELYFRDYLIDHPEEAKKYETLKLQLWKQYEHDRDGYTAAKTQLVTELTEKAKALYGLRYQ